MLRYGGAIMLRDVGAIMLRDGGAIILRDGGAIRLRYSGAMVLRYSRPTTTPRLDLPLGKIQDLEPEDCADGVEDDTTHSHRDCR